MGTPYYIAPEVLKMSYDTKCDIWSTGVFMYILLSGKPPFDGANNEEILQSVQQGRVDYSDPIWSMISDDGKDFLSQMLCYDPAERLSAQSCIQHKWFKQFDQTAIQ